jgi:thermitase
VNYVKKFSKLLAVSGFLLLAACSQAPAPKATPNGDFDRVATVNITSADTEASLEAKYGGEVVLMNQEAGLAMLGFYAGDFTALNTTTNANTFGTPEVTALGSSSWSGGGSAWSGGKSSWSGGWNAWSGGWRAWSGGTTSSTTIPVLPSENRAAWRDIKLSQAQALSRNYGAGVKVAILDTGIDLNHGMFSGRLAPSEEWKDFVSNDATPQEVAGKSYGHGTAVAGVILQAAPHATILPIRVLDGDGMGDTDNIAAAVDWAIQKGANVINMSLGTNVNDANLQAWVGYALSQGIYVVTSAGNNAGKLLYPALDAKTITYNGVNVSQYLISVGSVDAKMVRSGFSAYGTGLELMAPGEAVYTAFPDGQVGHATGTSFAAPQVAGVLALALGDTAAANKGQLQNYLTQSSYLLGASNGSGLMNAVGFMNRLPDVTRKQALFIVDFQNMNALLTGDNVFKTRLESIGYVVTVRDQDVLANSDFTGKHVVVVSSSIDESDLVYSFGSTLRNTNLPLITWEEDLFDDLRFNGGSYVVDNYATSETETKIRMVNSSHPLAAGYTGDVLAFNAVNQVAWSKLTSAPGAIKIATLTGDSSKAVVFGFEKNAQMSGMLAPGRRVGVFHNYYGASLTTPSLNFLEAAVTWAVTGN